MIRVKDARVARVGVGQFTFGHNGREFTARLEQAMIFSHFIKPAPPIPNAAPVLQHIVGGNLVKRLIGKR